MRGLGLAALLVASQAGATGFADHGRDLGAKPSEDVRLDGYFRVRG